MAVGIKMISQQAGVSISTVSHILSGRANRYSPKTREIVVSTAKELGYSPNTSARALVTGQTQRIAFWVPDMGAQFFQEMSCRFHRLLMTKHYEMIFREIGPHMQSPEKTVGLTQMDVDGVVMYGGVLGWLKPFLEADFPSKVPIVNMGVAYDGPLDFVQIELYPAALEAVRYLINSGRKRVAALAPQEMLTRFYGQYQAYNDVLQAAGMTPEYILFSDWHNVRAAARTLIQEYVREKGCPDAIFCFNDEFALGAYRGLLDLGKRVPEDVLLTGCDGIEDLEYLGAPISTIRQPMEKMCETAWQFLERRMKDPETARQTANLPAEFVVRK